MREPEVRSLLASALGELGISPEQIVDGAHLHSDLELDSTELVQISLEMKKQFGVDVRIDSGDDLTLAGVCDLVQRALSVHASA